jgi:MYXO-CTERM domain-containing protein
MKTSLALHTLRATTLLIGLLGAAATAWAVPCGPGDCGGDGALEAPPSCSSDEDCGAGFSCEIYADCGAPAPCNGEGCDEPVAPDCAPQGYCEPTPQGRACASDDDCGLGFACDFSGGSSGGAAPEPDSDQLAPEPVPVQEGVCVEAPVNGECQSSSDCPVGYHCEAAAVPPCAPGEDCVFVEPASACVPEQIFCGQDSDCPSEWTCEKAEDFCGDSTTSNEGDREDAGLVEPAPRPEPDCMEPPSLCVPPDSELICQESGCSIFARDNDEEAEGGGQGSDEGDGCAVSGPASAPVSGLGGLLLLGLAALVARRR